MRSPPPEEEGAAETTCDELTQTPIPRPPAPLEGEEVEKRNENVMFLISKNKKKESLLLYGKR